MQLSAFLNLIRWKNLLLILYTQLAIKYSFFTTFSTETNLTSFQFITLVLAVICITAAGYIINDIYDVEADIINKPKKLIITKYFPVETAKKLYFYTNTIGVSLGVLISLNIQKPSLSFIFIVAALLLYYYSKKLKSLPLIGNFVVASLVTLNILILIIFDLTNSFFSNNYFVITTILIVSFFAFCINLIREIIKDIEDINGDYALHMNTLPILLGRKRTKYIATILSVFPLIILALFVAFYSEEFRATSAYTVIFIILPLLYITLELPKTSTKKGFHKLSNILKIVMFFGVNIFIVLSISK